MENYEFEEKQIREGKLSIKVTKYFLQKIKSGLRIEVTRFSTKHSKTVEIELIYGDDQLILKKSYKKIILEKPKKSEVDATVKNFISFAKKNHLF